MTEDTQALSTIVESSNIDLAISGWLAEHSKSKRTHKAYAGTIQQFRAGLQRRGLDLDADVQAIMLTAQAFARGSLAKEEQRKKEQVADTSYNVRLAALSSFYDYAISRELILPLNKSGYVVNPLKAVKREKVEPYQHTEWLESEEVDSRLKHIDRSTLQGKRDYIILAILFQTGRRLQEIAALRWRHVLMTGKGKSKRVTLVFEHCKGDKTMRDELPAGYGKALLEWLHAYYGSELGSLAGDTPLWVTLSRNSTQRGQVLGVRAIERLSQKHLEVHTHVTRHSFAHAMIKAGATLPELQDRLGHASLATTGIYAKVFTGAKNPHGEQLADLFGVK